MKNLLTLILCTLSLAVFSQDEINIHNVPYIEVTGDGKLEVVPDEIYLSIYINEADKGTKSMEQLEKEMIKALEKLGIETSERLKVLDFTSDFKNRVIGQKINTSKQYELFLSDTKNVPPVFSNLEKIGISNINLIRVDHSQREELELDVKVLAVRSAKEKADKMLGELGNKVGKPLYIQERNVGYRQQYDQVRIRGTASFASEEQSFADLDFRTMVLQYGVQVRFGID